MNKKIIKSIFICLILIFSSLTTLPSLQAYSSPHAVKGTAYINGEIADTGIEIEIHFYHNAIFMGSESGTTFQYDGFNFNIGFEGREGQKGYFRINNQTPDDDPEPYVEIINSNGTYYYTDGTYYYLKNPLNFSDLDFEEPTKVTGLTVTDAKDGKLNLAWNPVTNVEVASYNLY